MTTKKKLTRSQSGHLAGKARLVKMTAAQRKHVASLGGKRTAELARLGKLAEAKMKEKGK